MQIYLHNRIKSCTFAVVKRITFMNELIKRTLFGALYVAVVVASIVWLPTYVFAFLFAIITPLAVREYCILLNMCRVRTIILMIFSEYVPKKREKE